MLIYIEFISRRPGISIEHFHAIAGAGQSGWAAQYGEDELVLNLGRTWRVGPEPEYLAAWMNRTAGLERLGQWEDAFRSGDADAFEKPMEVVARLDRAGCYRPLREPVPGVSGPYYAEFMDIAPGATAEEVAEFFDKRAAAHEALTLHLIADRIGHLGPDPRCIAIWGCRTMPGWMGSPRSCRTSRPPSCSALPASTPTSATRSSSTDDDGEEHDEVRGQERTGHRC